MRKANNDVGWLLTDDRQLLGFSLGFDFCYEHEGGVPYIRDHLGIPQKDIPVGVSDRTMTSVPKHLSFVKYDLKSEDKRSRKTWPAALLHLCSASEWHQLPVGGDLRAKELNLSFVLDPVKHKTYYDPVRHDLVCAWGATDGFAIHVRGAENVERLEKLFLAMGQCKVSLAEPSASGFSRKAMSLVLIEAVTPELASHVKNQDEAFKRLHDAASASGVEAALNAAGKEYYALSPRWREGEGSELLFFLNPRHQTKFAYGWYSVEDLMAWTKDEGPIVDGLAVKKVLLEADIDYGYHLVAGLNLCGIAINSYTEVWADPAKTVPALRLKVAKDSLPYLAERVYTMDELDVYLAESRKATASRQAEAAAKELASSTTA